MHNCVHLGNFSFITTSWLICGDESYDYKALLVILIKGRDFWYLTLLYSDMLDVFKPRFTIGLFYSRAIVAIDVSSGQNHSNYGANQKELQCTYAAIIQN